MKKGKILLFFLILIVSGLLVRGSETTMHYLTKGFADTLYCKLTGCVMEGDLDMNGYDILNVTFIDMNRTNATEICLDDTCIGNWSELSSEVEDIWVNASGDTMTGDLLPSPTLTQDLGSGPNRWDWLYVRNISVENVIAYNYFYPDGTSINDTLNSNFVPYSGAVKNVDLGANNFTVDNNTFFVDSTK